MENNLKNLFDYYKYVLSIENILSVKIKKSSLELEQDQIKIAKDAWHQLTIFEKDFKANEVTPSNIISQDFNMFTRKSIFFEKVSGISYVSKKSKNKTQQIEDYPRFTFGDENLYQYSLIIGFFAEPNKEKSYFYPASTLMFSSHDEDFKKLSPDIIHEHIKLYVEPNYKSNIVENYLKDNETKLIEPIVVVNPKIKEFYEVKNELFTFNKINISKLISLQKEVFEDKTKFIEKLYYGAISQNYTRGLLKIYDSIDYEDISVLLKNYFSIHPTKIAKSGQELIANEDLIGTKKKIIASLSQIGAFDKKFSLANTQREAMSCYLQNDKNIIPINGAPGTGKTSLLRAISGDYIVKSSLKSFEDFLNNGIVSYKTPIVATSTNNQALWNISEGIASGFEDTIAQNPDSILYKRWIDYKHIINNINLSGERYGDEEEHKELDEIDFSTMLFVPSVKTKARNSYEITKGNIKTILEQVGKNRNYFLKKFNEAFNKEPEGKNNYEKYLYCAKYLYGLLGENIKEISSFDTVENINELFTVENTIIEKWIHKGENRLKYTLFSINRNIEKLKPLFEQEEIKDTDYVQKLEDDSNSISIKIGSFDNKIVNLQKNILDLNNYIEELNNKIESNKELIKNPSIHSNFSKYYEQELEKLKIDENEKLKSEMYQTIDEAFNKSNWITQLIYNFLNKGYFAEVKKRIEEDYSSKFDVPINLRKNISIQANEYANNKIIKNVNDENLDVANQINSADASMQSIMTEKEKTEDLLLRFQASSSEIQMKINIAIDKIEKLEYLLKHEIAPESDYEVSFDVAKLLTPYASLIFQINSILENKDKLDKSIRTDNFYLALHLLEALFFLERENESEDFKNDVICPVCKDGSFIYYESSNQFACKNCKAKSILNYAPDEVKNETPAWFGMLFKNKKAIKNNILYRPTFNKGNDDKVFINIKEDVKTNIFDFNSILPIFPIINITTNSLGTIVSTPDGKVDKNIFDFMLIDEAGTITPHKMIILHTAKKAMLFGDVKQLKPVFGYTNTFENNILKMFTNSEYKRKIILDYFSCAGDEIGLEDDIELIAYRANNAMDVANNATKFFLPYSPSKLEGDIWLKEHFRCRDSIIQISNELTYQDEIVSNKPDSKRNMHLYFVKHNFTSDRNNRNIKEAKSILDFIFLKKESIKRNLSEIKNIDVEDILDEDFYSSIGIITPFANQHSLIERMRDEMDNGNNFKNIKVGTVHKYQGSERDIIIFSSVYGKNDIHRASTFFFNRTDTSMINVAVTRAKEMFYCFGNLEAMKTKGTHSEVMVRHILEHNNPIGIDK